MEENPESSSSSTDDIPASVEIVDISESVQEESVEEGSVEIVDISESVQKESVPSSSKEVDKINFKLPHIGPRKSGGLITTPKEPAVKKTPSNVIPALQLYSDPNVKKEKIIPLPYEEPDWGGEIAPEDFKFEILKSGVIIETIPLNTKSFYVFGRLSNCDIQTNHPSSSRYHAVLQYRHSGEQRGFYLYDLSSTHGTFLNKQRIKPKVYAPVKVGHVISIGGSSRMLILQGPEELQEPESELTLTELKEQRRQKEIQKKLDEERREQEEIEKEEKRKKKEEEAGIDWGMGDDADEETDLSENPFASTTNEELFLTDPKKSLRGWFEREGHELNYDVTERNNGQFLCRVTIPVDDAQGRPLVAEALVKGKKKEAVVQCAMEACRVLDRQGLFRQAKHEGRGQRRKRDWEEDDFYDSDDDNYLDRTGTIEMKRQKRMAALGKSETKAETYESLLSKLEELRKEICEAEHQVQSSTTSVASEGVEGVGGDEDALDAFMNTLKHQADKQTKDKITQRAAKARVEKLRQEESRLLRLANIARPASLPPLISASTGQTKKLGGALTGARPSSSTKSKPKISSSIPAAASCVSGEIEVESEEDEPEKVSEIPPEVIPEPVIAPVQKDESSEKAMSVRSLGPSIPPEMLRQLRGGDKEEEGESKPQKTRTRHRPSSKKGGANLAQVESEEDYSNWVPPAGQTGDGRTNLNAKFGY